MPSLARMEIIFLVISRDFWLEDTLSVDKHLSQLGNQSEVRDVSIVDLKE